MIFKKEAVGPNAIPAVPATQNIPVAPNTTPVKPNAVNPAQSQNQSIQGQINQNAGSEIEQAFEVAGLIKEFSILQSEITKLKSELF
jgi:hypothetical protein